MKRNLLLVAFVFSAIYTNAKNNLHTFQVRNDTYTELSGDIDITAPVVAYDSFIVTALNGETIAFFGQPLTLNGNDKFFQVNPDGRIWVMRDTAMSLFDAMESTPMDTLDKTSKVSYKVEGAGFNKVIKVQWKNFTLGNGQPGNFVNMQTWIYTETGIIEYHYGPRSASNGSGFTDPAKGIYIGIWYSNWDFSKVYEKIQVTGTQPNITIDSARTTNVPHVQGAPADGAVYVFTPKQGPAAIKGLQQLQCTVHPNPANDELIFSCKPLTEDARVLLFDVSGKLVKAEILLKSKTQLNIPVANLPAGAYLLQLVSEKTQSSLKINLAH